MDSSDRLLRVRQISYRHELALLGSGHHDLNPNARLPEWGSNTSTYRGILPIDPVVPNGIVIVKIVHVRQPHLGDQKLRFVGTGHLQKLIDALQHLPSLHLHVTDGVGGDTTETNDELHALITRTKELEGAARVAERQKAYEIQHVNRRVEDSLREVAKLQERNHELESEMSKVARIGKREEMDFAEEART